MPAGNRFISGLTSLWVPKVSVPKNNVQSGAAKCIEDQSSVLNILKQFDI